MKLMLKIYDLGVVMHLKFHQDVISYKGDAYIFMIFFSSSAITLYETHTEYILPWFCYAHEVVSGYLK